MEDIADALFSVIYDGGLLGLICLIAIFGYISEHVSESGHRVWAKRCFVVVFIAFCLYGFDSLQDADTERLASVAFRGLLAGVLAYGISAILFSLLSVILGTPIGWLQEFVRSVNDATVRLCRGCVQRLEDYRRRAKAKRQRRHLAAHPPPTHDELHTRKIEAQADDIIYQLREEARLAGDLPAKPDLQQEKETLRLAVASLPTSLPADARAKATVEVELRIAEIDRQLADPVSSDQQIYDKAITANPGNAALYVQRAVWLRSVNEPERAEADLRKALRLFPGYRRAAAILQQH